jgi:TonB family protein
VKPPDPTAVAIRSKTQPKPSPTDSSNLRYRPETTYKPNQIYSPQAPAAVSQMFAKTGAGTIGLDQNSVLGSRFGGYAALLMQRVAERWHTNGLEGVHAPYAIVAVDIFRNGTTRNVKLTQTSGNYQLDTSALRAVTEAAPLPPLPAEYERDMVNVEFRFQIQK